MNDWLDRAGCQALKLLSWFFSLLPLEAALALGRFGGWAASFFVPRRRFAYADLKAALGPDYSEKQIRQILKKQFLHFGEMFAEVMRLKLFSHAERERYIEIRHRERARNPQGLIFLTAHFGNWELLQMISGTIDLPIHVLARPQKHPRMNQLLNEMREVRGATQAVHVGGMGMRDIFRVLKKGGVVGMLGDRSGGKQEGVIVPFFGRKTTVPTGAFELAARTGAKLVPVFLVRRKGHFHDLQFEEPIVCSEQDRETQFEQPVLRYVALLEQFIRKHPEQWLWLGKRWKYSWTKRLLILSDGKPGHVKQSEALKEHFQSIQTQYGRGGLEFPSATAEVRFRSSWHQKCFSVFSLLWIPLAQGRLSWLKGFLTPESYEKLRTCSADFVISAGSGLIPLNLGLARDFGAKSVVMMKPPFPFHFFPYDLTVIPAHDTGWMPQNTLRTLLAPSRSDRLFLAQDAEKLKRGLKDPSRIKMGIFVGGNTKQFQIAFSSIEYLVSSVQKLSKRFGDYMLTTSRRTSPSVTQYLKERLTQDPACQLFVDAHQDKRPEVAGGMMMLADILIVTEDSVSMISEAVSTGKKVIVVTFETSGLPSKHLRFRRLLAERGAIRTARPQELEKAVEAWMTQTVPPLAEDESRLIRNRVQEML